MEVGVVGISGYSGLELVRILKHHPAAKLRVGFSTQAVSTLKDYLPAPLGKSVPVVDAAEILQWAKQLNTIFLATPAEVSADLAPRILDAGANVIDLSGAFRLKAGDKNERLARYQQWYKLAHPHPELLEVAEYGLCPWISSGAVKGPRLVANPGCYATAVLMALLPLLKRNLVDAESIVIDAKSGTSGAGRKAAEHLLFTEVDGECLPYRIGKHQHLPEIREYAQAFGGVDLEPTFTTHLLAVRRGIIAGIYGKLKRGVTELDVTSAYAHDYSDYGLVEWGSLGKSGDRADAFALSLKRIAGTGQTRVHYQIHGRQLYLFSLIDNLIKGAAGQAIENLNRLHELPLSLGLTELEGLL